jgi:hypothetical protein
MLFLSPNEPVEKVTFKKTPSSAEAVPALFSVTDMAILSACFQDFFYSLNARR